MGVPRKGRRLIGADLLIILLAALNVGPCRAFFWTSYAPAQTPISGDPPNGWKPPTLVPSEVVLTPGATAGGSNWRPPGTYQDLLRLPQILCSYAATGRWPLYPAYLRPAVIDLGRHVFALDDVGVRQYCSQYARVVVVWRPCCAYPVYPVYINPGRTTTTEASIDSPEDVDNPDENEEPEGGDEEGQEEDGEENTENGDGDEEENGAEEDNEEEGNADDGEDQDQGPDGEDEAENGAEEGKEEDGKDEKEGDEAAEEGTENSTDANEAVENGEKESGNEEKAETGTPKELVQPPQESKQISKRFSEPEAGTYHKARFDGPRNVPRSGQPSIPFSPLHPTPIPDLGPGHITRKRESSFGKDAPPPPKKKGTFRTIKESNREKGHSTVSRKLETKNGKPKDGPATNGNGEKSV